MDFIEVVRQEEKNIAVQFDAKIKHYFNAAYQNLNSQQQKKAQISIEETRQLLKLIVDGIRKTIDTMDRKFEQFLTIQKNGFESALQQHRKINIITDDSIAQSSKTLDVMNESQTPTKRQVLHGNLRHDYAASNSILIMHNSDSLDNI